MLDDGELFVMTISVKMMLTLFVDSLVMQVHIDMTTFHSKYYNNYFNNYFHDGFLAVEVALLSPSYWTVFHAFHHKHVLLTALAAHQLM